MRLNAYESSKLYKERMKAYHDKKKILKKEFYPGQSILLFNSRLRLFPRKLKSKWLSKTDVLSMRIGFGARIEFIEC